MERRRSYEKTVVAAIEKLRKVYPVTEIGRPKVGGREYPMFALEVGKSGAGQPEVYLHAGLHGNEPAGVFALLSFIEKGIEEYPQYHFSIIPCVSPSSFELDMRGNGNGVDLNRNFAGPAFEAETGIIRQYIERQNRAYLAVLDLHEDPTDQPVEGFDISANPTALYVYEKAPLSLKGTHTPGRKIVSALREENIPIWEGNSVYHDPCDAGLVWEGSTGVPESGGSFDAYVNERIRFCYTAETPTMWDIDVRIWAQVMFIHRALEVLLEEQKIIGVAHR